MYVGPLCNLRSMTEQFKELYPSLSHLGFSPELLLAVAEDSDNGEAIEDLHVPKVTNRTMLELHNFLNRNSSCTYYTYWQWTSSLLGSSRTTSNFPTIKSIRQSIVRLSSKLAKFKKLPNSDEKSSKLTEFFDLEYELPHVFVAKRESCCLSVMR